MRPTTFQNLGQLHAHQAKRLGPRPALRFKRDGLYRDLTWSEYRSQAIAGACALLDSGVAHGDRVGLLAENRVEWLIADMAILTAGGVTVSPHASLTAKQIQYQLHDAEVVWAIVSTPAQMQKIVQVRAELPHLRGVVLMDAQLDTSVESWAGFLQRGARNRGRLGSELEQRQGGVKGSDLATIMYTSGTTGNPKGVMLTHDNLLSNARACLEVSDHQPGDVVLNWLPYTHIYARTIDHYKGLFSGVLTCLAESNETLVENLAEVQPTHMASVPRFYEKMLAAVASEDAEKTGRRLRNIFGPRVDWLSSGGAPLPLAVAHAFQAAGLLVLQGYGLTESSPVISFNSKKAYKLDTVGRAIPGVEVRIAPDGEILTRGSHVMKGYWKNPRATDEMIKDGWLHTGDLGELDGDGFLKITGRKKELLVLSNGKKIVPSYIEGLLISDPCIDQAVVFGEGRSYLVALVVPQWENLREQLRQKGETLSDDPAACARSPAVRAAMEERIKQALRDLSPAEQVKQLVILPRPLSVEGEELTVSLKLRRNVILDKYRSAIEAAYSR